MAGMKECTRLLDNMLDSLDRLFDRESGVIDVYAIVSRELALEVTDPLRIALADALE